jgi:hypothetical protein
VFVVVVPISLSIDAVGPDENPAAALFRGRRLIFG